MNLAIDKDALRRVRRASRNGIWFSLAALLYGGTLVDLVLSPTWSSAFLAVSTAVIIASGITYFTALTLGRVQIRDELTATLSGAVASDRMLVLFLRSFDVAQSGPLQRVMEIINVLTALVARDGRQIGSGRYDAEEHLDDAIDSEAMFVAIGDKRASFGAAKIIVKDEDWQETFRRLTDAAQLIFMMPGPSPAVLWELSQIMQSQNLLDKTIFIMPRAGSMPLFSRGSLGKGAEATAWVRLTETVFRELGVTLPRYHSEGCFFRLRSGHPCETLGLEQFTAQLKKSLTQRPNVHTFDVRDAWQLGRPYTL